MPNVDIHHLSYGYKNHQVFTDADVTFQAGEISLLVGDSGSGKSTLFKMITGLIDHPNVQVDAHLVGMVFQNPNQQFTLNTPRNELLFALENLQLDPDLMPEQVEQALSFVGMTEFADRQLLTLSGGEKQKIALAIVVAMNRQIILLDEPFASIDPQSRRDLLQKLRELRAEGKTVVIADHDLSGYRGIIDTVFQINNQRINQLSDQEGQAMLQGFERRIDLPELSLPTATASPVFTFQQLHLQQQDRILLDHSDLALIANKITLLTGPNGIGKSTLFQSLARITHYDGVINFKTANIQKFRAKQYARHVALLFQDAESQFLAITVAEELALSKQHRHQSYFTDALIDQTLDFLELTPLLEQVVYTLSEGQKKKLQILLLLIICPDVILLDEPLKGLDEVSVTKILQVIHDCQTATNQTVILISHQFNGLAGLIDFHIEYNNKQLNYRKRFA